MQIGDKFTSVKGDDMIEVIGITKTGRIRYLRNGKVNTMGTKWVVRNYPVKVAQ